MATKQMDPVFKDLEGDHFRVSTEARFSGIPMQDITESGILTTIGETKMRPIADTAKFRVIVMDGLAFESADTQSQRELALSPERAASKVGQDKQKQAAAYMTLGDLAKGRG